MSAQVVMPSPAASVTQIAMANGFFRHVIRGFKVDGVAFISDGKSGRWSVSLTPEIPALDTPADLEEARARLQQCLSRIGIVHQVVYLYISIGGGGLAKWQAIITPA